MITFGDRLKELRLADGLTQAGLAEKSGVPLGTIREYEQGKRDPLLTTAQKLANALSFGLEAFNGVSAGVRGKDVRAPWKGADATKRLPKKKRK